MNKCRRCPSAAVPWHRCAPGAPGAAVRLIDREALAFNEFVFERFQMRVIELKLQLESAIRQAAPLAQEGNRLIHHRDKVHRVSSLSRVRPPCACAMPS